jgi:hypothetical protein
MQMSQVEQILVTHLIVSRKRYITALARASKACTSALECNISSGHQPHMMSHIKPPNPEDAMQQMEETTMAFLRKCGHHLSSNQWHQKCQVPHLVHDNTVRQA